MDARTVGVEEEFQVVDLATGELVPRAAELLQCARPALGDRVTRELNLCQIETGSPVCQSLDDVLGNLLASRLALAEAGAEVGLGIAPVGTHPTGRWQEQQVDRSSRRFRRMEERFQVVAREQIICGCHVHVGVDDADLRVATIARLGPWLPVLLALSTNSPFWQGRDTGFASYRHQLWQRWPTAGMPPELSSVAEYERVVAELVDTGVIDDASYLYWYARPSLRYPTVEVRVCDTFLSATDAATVAGLVRALVWTEAKGVEEGRRPARHPREVLEAAMWRASRYGVDEGLVSAVDGRARPALTVVDELLAHVAEGLDAHGDRHAVGEGVNRLLARGTGAMRQRAAIAATGDPRSVMEAVVEGSASAA